LFLVIVSLVVT